jgi:starch synthase
VLDGILAGTDLAPPDPTGTRPRSGAAPRPAAPGALQGAPR